MARAGDHSSPEQLARRFAEIEPAMSPLLAMAEASRCLYCFDAPCTRACPTSIDVPRFIRQIHHRDTVGAARTILDANIFGGSCARACPTEVLCEGACVDRLIAQKPIPIGRLQRFACDAAMTSGSVTFEPGPSTGKRVAIVGSGPAGLSCAHELRRIGHHVAVFEARSMPGGLGTYGIAAYKVSTEFALSEVEMVRSIGIDIRLNEPISPSRLGELIGEYDAAFLGIGLGRTASLGIVGEDLVGVWEALRFINQTHTRPFEECEVGRQVVVIGAGNTAIDAATAAKRLGAESVTVFYRRDEAAMSAFAFEYELAKADGIRFEWNATPIRFAGDALRQLHTIVVSRSDSEDGLPICFPADMAIIALGQGPLTELLGSIPGLEPGSGPVLVDPATGATKVPGLFAGGDCLRRGGEIVDAVRDGKAAARGIDAYLRSKADHD